MKRLVVIIGLTFLLSGCFGKTVCKSPNGENDVDISYTIKYYDDNVRKVVLDKTYNFSTKEELENYSAIMNYTIKKDTTDNIIIDSKKKNNKYILTYRYNVNKMNEEELKQSGLKRNKTELINYLNSNGFTCK